MRVIRKSFKVASGAVISFAYIKANWFERATLDAMMLRGRHNLRYAHNWAEARRHKAYYVMKRKNAPNRDPGPDPSYISPVRKLSTHPEFTWLDMGSMVVGTTLWTMGLPKTGAACLVVLGAIALYLRHKLLKVN